MRIVAPAPCTLFDRTSTLQIYVWPNIRLLGVHFCLIACLPVQGTLIENPPPQCTLPDRTPTCSVHIIWPNIRLLGAHWPNIRMLGAHYLTEYPTVRCIVLPNIHGVEVRGMKQTWVNLRFLNYRKPNATCKFPPVSLISNSFDLD